MSETNLTSGTTDAIKELGETALDAAGIGWSKIIWDLFFPSNEEMFSEAQLEQLQELFSQLLGEQSYEEAYNKFKASAMLSNEYIDSDERNPAMRADLQSKTADEASQILDHGWTSARVYLASMSLHILSLKFNYEAATTPDEKAAAGNVIGGAVLTTLSNLLDLESAYADSTTWDHFANFKTWITKGVANIAPPEAVAAFGDEYPDRVQQMLGLVQAWVPESMGEVLLAPYSMAFLPFDDKLAPLTWTGYGSDGYLQSYIYMYQVQSVDPSLPAGFVPLSDLAIAPGNGQPQAEPKMLIYISGNASALAAATSFNHVYDDRGDDDDQSYAAFRTSPDSVGIWTSVDDRASQPDYPHWAQLPDPKYTTQVKLQYAQWTSNGLHSDQDVVAWGHPDFGDYHVYFLTRSFDTDPGVVVPGLSKDAIKGHPIYKPEPEPTPPS